MFFIYLIHFVEHYPVCSKFIYIAHLIQPQLTKVLPPLLAHSHVFTENSGVLLSK